jgi:hypothetical protein
MIMNIRIMPLVDIQLNGVYIFRICWLVSGDDVAGVYTNHLSFLGFNRLLKLHTRIRIIWIWNGLLRGVLAYLLFYFGGILRPPFHLKHLIRR